MIVHRALCGCGDCIMRRSRLRDTTLAREQRLGLRSLLLDEPVERNPLTHHGVLTKRLAELDDFEAAT